MCARERGTGTDTRTKQNKTLSYIEHNQLEEQVGSLLALSEGIISESSLDACVSVQDTSHILLIAVICWFCI